MNAPRRPPPTRRRGPRDRPTSSIRPIVDLRRRPRRRLGRRPGRPRPAHAALSRGQASPSDRPSRRPPRDDVASPPARRSTSSTEPTCVELRDEDGRRSTATAGSTEGRGSSASRSTGPSTIVAERGLPVQPARPDGRSDSRAGDSRRTDAGTAEGRAAPRETDRTR